MPKPLSLLKLFSLDCFRSIVGSYIAIVESRTQLMYDKDTMLQQSSTVLFQDVVCERYVALAVYFVALEDCRLEIDCREQ